MGHIDFLQYILIVADIEERGGDNTVEVLSSIHTLAEEEREYFRNCSLCNVASPYFNNSGRT